MYSPPAARFDDLTNYQQSGMAGLVPGPFLPQPADAHACQQQRSHAAAPSSLPPIVMKASRHDESQTTPRKAVQPAEAAQQAAMQYEAPRQPKYGAPSSGMVNIQASTGGHAAAEHSSARWGSIRGGPPTARAPAYGQQQQQNYGGGSGMAAPSGPQQADVMGASGAQQQPGYTHSSTLRTAAELLNSLTNLAGPGGEAARAAAIQAPAGGGAPRPLQLPPMFARDGALPLPTARKLQPPPTSRPPMTSRVVPMSTSPYLAPVPGYSTARPPPVAAARSARAGVAAPVQQSADVQRLRQVPGLPLAGQPVDDSAPAQTSRPSKSNVYAWMSQGLPAIETPRTARAQQQLLQQAGGQPVASPRYNPLARAQGQPAAVQQWGQPPGPLQQSYLAQAGIPMDSPTQSTGLTPRTARLMQRFPGPAPAGAAGRSYLAPQAQLQPQQALDPGMPPQQAGPMLDQGHFLSSGQYSVPEPQPSYPPSLGAYQRSGEQPKYAPDLYSGSKRQSMEATDTEMVDSIKAVHAAASGPVGLAAVQQFAASNSSSRVVEAGAPLFPLPGIMPAVQQQQQHQAARVGALGSLPEQTESLMGLPGEPAVYELQPRVGELGRLPSNSRPLRPPPPSELSRAESMFPAPMESIHSMPQIYHPLQEQQPQQAALHASLSADAFPTTAAAAPPANSAVAAAAAYLQQQEQLAAQYTGSRRASYQGESAPASAAARPASESRSATASRLPSPGTPSRQGVPGAHALRQYEALLTPFEQSEVLAVPEVWFAGRHSAQKIQGDKTSGDPNYGYDDARGDYMTVVNDHIAYRYEVLDVLGRGSFGQVLRCLDHATGQGVALKIIRNKRRFQKQAQIEANILQKLQEADPHDSVNIVRTYSSFHFRSHLCITFELLSLNLYEYIKACNFQGSSLTVIRRIAQQVLACLQFLRQQNIVHCDLKPENILLVERGKTAVKVIDFGSSCYVDQRMYTYIQSRFYRSPEVILGLPYGLPIDMWSLGCILAELLTGQPLFPGEDEKEQLACIMEIMGPPPLSLLEGAPRANLFFNTATGSPLPCAPNSRGKTHRTSAQRLEGALRGCRDEAFLDFLRRCLEWSPEERMTPDEAMEHEWIARGSLRGTPPSRLGSAGGGLYRHPSNMAATNSAVPLPGHLGIKP